MSVRSMSTPHFGHRRWPTGGGVVGSNLRGRGITRYSVALPITHGELSSRRREWSSHYLGAFVVPWMSALRPKCGRLGAEHTAKKCYRCSVCVNDQKPLTGGV